MKLKFQGGIGIMTAILLASGCSNEEVMNDVNPPNSPLASVESVQLTGIRNYIASTGKSTRGVEADIRPYIDADGDTLMYIADYGEGWELFSNSLTAPMSLIKSDTGDFSSVLESSNPVFGDIFDSLIEALKSDKRNQKAEYHDGSEQWTPYASAPTPKPDPGTGKVKTLVGTKTNPDVNVSISHLLKTKWGQGYPYNQFMYKDDTNSLTMGHILVGCTAVATGQLLYYSHYKWDNPSLAPSVATFNDATNRYVFSQFTTQQWDKMYQTTPKYYWEEDPSVGIFLGWIAHTIKAYPLYENGIHTATAASFALAADFIKNQTGCDTSVKDYNRYEISSMLMNGKPVPFWLLSANGGHVVVIDEIDYHESSGIFYYAYVSTGGGSTAPEPTPGPPSTSTDPEYDALVAKYGTIISEPFSNSTSYFRFNWGYEGNMDDDYYINGDILSFVCTSSKGNISYSLYQYIDYDIQ